MARKGSRKTRTGCVTCKIRKVKCDEAKPSCNRCVATGRQCDGYVPVESLPAKGPNSDLRQYRPQHAFPGINSAGEGRALQYFCETAGPYLSGAIDPYFMSKLVMQFTHFEPAARHTVVAISSLCERMSGRPDPDVEQEIRLQDESFALRHYNAAIHDLRKMNSEAKQPVVLLVCILFICLELLQSNQQAAMEHFKHGFAILRDTVTDSAWTKEHLLPLFRRISIWIFLYTDDASYFPDISGLQHPVPDTFSTFADAQKMIDDIFSRTLRLVRLGDPFRIRRRRPVPPALFREQDNIRGSLNQWKILFDDFKTRSASPPREGDPKDRPPTLSEASRYVLSSRYDSCRIWVNTALGMGGHGKKDHDEAPDCRAFEESGVLCDSGYVPAISVISTRCYHLEARLKALNLVPVPGLPRENICMQSRNGKCSADPSSPSDGRDSITPLSDESP